MKLFIWFNPLANQYQQGSKDEYEKAVSTCGNGASVVLLYELSEVSRRLATKITNELNTAHFQLQLSH
ncbi:MAG: hypothetical protein OEY56_03970 [Cyclobacteriaceae bacterium]|nr:hypothetical protein [Cyclobacteriaceae bacterium]